jgi:hypothetical protein
MEHAEITGENKSYTKEINEQEGKEERQKE